MEWRTPMRPRLNKAAEYCVTHARTRVSLKLLVVNQRAGDLCKRPFMLHQARAIRQKRARTRRCTTGKRAPCCPLLVFRGFDGSSGRLIFNWIEPSYFTEPTFLNSWRRKYPRLTRHARPALFFDLVLLLLLSPFFFLLYRTSSAPPNSRNNKRD